MTDQGIGESDVEATGLTGTSAVDDSAAFAAFAAVADARRARAAFELERQRVRWARVASLGSVIGALGSAWFALLSAPSQLPKSLADFNLINSAIILILLLMLVIGVTRFWRWLYSLRADRDPTRLPPDELLALGDEMLVSRGWFAQNLMAPGAQHSRRTR